MKPLIIAETDNGYVLAVYNTDTIEMPSVSLKDVIYIGKFEESRVYAGDGILNAIEKYFGAKETRT